MAKFQAQEPKTRWYTRLEARLVAFFTIISGAIAFAQYLSPTQSPAPTPVEQPKSTLDARGHLFKEMGIAWSEENFWSAVKRGDDRAVVLFLSGGMAVSAAGLHEVLTNKDLIKKAPLDKFIELAKNRNGDFCSSAMWIQNRRPRKINLLLDLSDMQKTSYQQGLFKSFAEAANWARH
jgi:hypothetical protein